MPKDTPWKEPLTILRRLRDTPLPTAAYAILVSLALRADSQGKCYPSLDLLAHDTGLHRITVCKWLETIRKAGALTKHRDRGKSTGYTLKFTPVALSRIALTDQLREANQTAHELPSAKSTGRKRTRQTCPTCLRTVLCYADTGRCPVCDNLHDLAEAIYASRAKESRK